MCLEHTVRVDEVSKINLMWKYISVALQYTTVLYLYTITRHCLSGCWVEIARNGTRLSGACGTVAVSRHSTEWCTWNSGCQLTMTDKQVKSNYKPNCGNYNRTANQLTFTTKLPFCKIHPPLALRLIPFRTVPKHRPIITIST